MKHASSSSRAAALGASSWKWQRSTSRSGGYLGYALDEPLPDHSSLTRIRTRLGVDIFQRFFDRVVQLCQHVAEPFASDGASATDDLSSVARSEGAPPSRTGTACSAAPTERATLGTTATPTPLPGTGSRSWSNSSRRRMRGKGETLFYRGNNYETRVRKYSASATSAAVQPPASSQKACQRPRSRGVGGAYTCSRTTPMSSSQPVSTSNASRRLRSSSGAYCIHPAYSTWLWFRMMPWLSRLHTFR